MKNQELIMSVDGMTNLEKTSYKVGDELCNYVAAPGYGYLKYKITEINENGIFGVLLEDKVGELRERDVV